MRECFCFSFIMTLCFLRYCFRFPSFRHRFFHAFGICFFNGLFFIHNSEISDIEVAFKYITVNAHGSLFGYVGQGVPNIFLINSFNEHNGTVIICYRRRNAVAYTVFTARRSCECRLCMLCRFVGFPNGFGRGNILNPGISALCFLKSCLFLRSKISVFRDKPRNPLCNLAPSEHNL